MLKLIPSAGIVKETKIDFDLLSFIISRFFLPTKRVVLKVHKTRFDYSYFCSEDGMIGLDLKSNKTLLQTVKTILHELRHYIQTKHFKIEFEEYDDKYYVYYNSAEEKDARTYEKLASEVCRIYKSYTSIDKKIIDLKLENFNELV